MYIICNLDSVIIKKYACSTSEIDSMPFYILLILSFIILKSHTTQHK